MITRHEAKTNGRKSLESVKLPDQPMQQSRSGAKHVISSKPRNLIDWFHLFSKKCSDIVGHPWSFILAVAIILGWGVSGPLFGFSDTWQLIINTATTIVTFIMVFLIQNTQNRDARAVHLKLDELLHAVKGARNHLINLEDLSEEELDKLHKEFEKLREHHAVQKKQAK